MSFENDQLLSFNAKLHAFILQGEDRTVSNPVIACREMTDVPSFCHVS